MNNQKERTTRRAPAAGGAVIHSTKWRRTGLCLCNYTEGRCHSVVVVRDIYIIFQYNMTQQLA